MIHCSNLDLTTLPMASLVYTYKTNKNEKPKEEKDEPGNFLGLRKGTNFAPIANAIAGPNMNPLASTPEVRFFFFTNFSFDNTQNQRGTNPLTKFARQHFQPTYFLVRFSPCFLVAATHSLTFSSPTAINNDNSLRL